MQPFPHHFLSNWCFRSSRCLYSVDDLMLMWRGCPFHLLFYDPAIVSLFKAITMINGYANILHLTLWAHNLKFDLMRAFRSKKSQCIRLCDSGPELSHRTTAITVVHSRLPFRGSWISDSETWLKVLMNQMRRDDGLSSRRSIPPQISVRS